MKYGATFIQLTVAASLSCRLFGNCGGIHVKHASTCGIHDSQDCTCKPDVMVRGSGVMVSIDRQGRQISGEPAAIAAEAHAWGVFHPASGGFDGWYFDRDDAQSMLTYFRKDHPGESFYLVSRKKSQQAATHRPKLVSKAIAQHGVV